MTQPRPLHRTLLGAVALLACTMLFGGCVGQGEYDRLYETNRSLTNRNAELQRERDEARAQADLMRGNIGSSAGTLADLQAQNAALKAQLDKALADFSELQNRIAGLKFGPLDSDTDQALAALAAQYPDLIKYDSSRGMLRFASDLTFDSGSDVVKEDAKRALAALGQILNNSAASGYDVYVEGHTDSQRISSNTAKRFPTNRYLSAARSISVINELAKLGVKPGRMLAAGWGEWRPAVPNTSSGNTPANRRVEIFLVKASAGTMMLDESQVPAERSSGSAKPKSEKPPARPVDMSK